MSSSQYPEVRLAARVIEKHSLTAPINIRALLESYATVLFQSIPIDRVDGIALNIKVPGEKPLVIINQDIPITRQNFTMAHELGHLIIPWHTGIKIDDKDPDYIYSEKNYSGVEAEANRFASALLMPESYINQIVNDSENLAQAHSLICLQLTVSAKAAAIQMSKVLPTGIIYCAERNGVVDYSGRTERTTGQIPTMGDEFVESNFPSHGEHSVWNSGNVSIHWWKKASKHLSERIKSLIEFEDDSRTWRAILDEILRDADLPKEVTDYKKSLSGAIGSLNSHLVHTEGYNVESLALAIFERLNSDDYKDLAQHDDFEIFLVKRAKDIISKRSKVN